MACYGLLPSFPCLFQLFLFHHSRCRCESGTVVGCPQLQQEEVDPHGDERKEQFEAGAGTMWQQVEMNPGVDPRLTELKSDGKIGKKLVSQLIQTHKHGNSVTFQTHLFWCRPCFFLGAKENTDLHHNIRPTGLASHHLFYFGHVLTLFIYSYIMLHRYLLPAP